jgi:hypothetical protein
MPKMSAAGFCGRLEAGWRPAVRTETILADRYAGPHPGLTLAESCSAIKPCVTLSHFSYPRNRKMITGVSGGGEWFSYYFFMQISNFVWSSSLWKIPCANLRENQHYGHHQFAYSLRRRDIGVKMTYVARKLRVMNSFPSASKFKL